MHYFFLLLTSCQGHCVGQLDERNIVRCDSGLEIWMWDNIVGIDVHVDAGRRESWLGHAPVVYRRRQHHRPFHRPVFFDASIFNHKLFKYLSQTSPSRRLSSAPIVHRSRPRCKKLEKTDAQCQLGTDIEQCWLLESHPRFEIRLNLLILTTTLILDYVCIRYSRTCGFSAHGRQQEAL